MLLRRAWPLAAGLAFGLSLVIRVGDGDPWWHLRTGQWILEHGAIPRVDPFSHTAEGPWRYTEAAAQVLYALAHRALGDASLTIVNAVLAGVLACALALATRAKPGAALAATGLAAAAAHSAMSAKPQVFSYLLFVALLALLRCVERRAPRRRVAIVGVALAMGLAWGWLHRGGVLGVAVALAAPIAWAIDRERRPLVPLGAAIALALTLGLAANPGGLFYFASAIDLAGRSSFRELLVDWQPPTLALLFERHLALAPLVLLAVVERARVRRVDVELLVLIGTAALASRSIRFVPFFAFACALPAARAIEAGLDALASRVRSVRPALLGGAAAILGLAAIGAQHAAHVVPAYVGAGAMEARLPVELSGWLRRNPPPGARWNSFDLGGYLLYALAPEQRVFIDGRNDTVYGDAFFRAALASGSDPRAFARLDDRYRFGHAVLAWRDVARADLAFLHADPDWALVYWDDVGAVLVRRTPEARAYLDAHGYQELRLDTAFARTARLASQPPDAWSEADRTLARELLRNAEEAPRSIRAAFLAAWVLRATGDPRYAAVRADVNRRAAERGLSLTLP